MRDGPPPWVHAPALSTSAIHAVDDARIHAEIWSEGIRFLAEGHAEDDAAWLDETWNIGFSLEEAVCLCNTLATGRDTSHEEEAWKRVYQRVFSLDSHTSTVQSNPALQQIWFYPMTERRMVFRMQVGPLITALTALMQWARGELPLINENRRGSQTRQLRRCQELLEPAARRMVSSS